MSIICCSLHLIVCLFLFCFLSLSLSVSLANLIVLFDSILVKWYSRTATIKVHLGLFVYWISFYYLCIGNLFHYYFYSVQVLTKTPKILFPPTIIVSIICCSLYIWLFVYFYFVFSLSLFLDSILVPSVNLQYVNNTC